MDLEVLQSLGFNRQLSREAWARWVQERGASGSEAPVDRASDAVDTMRAPPDAEVIGSLVALVPAEVKGRPVLWNEGICIDLEDVERSPAEFIVPHMLAVNAIKPFVGFERWNWPKYRRI